jgi:hypothetical protein
MRGQPFSATHHSLSQPQGLRQPRSVSHTPVFDDQGAASVRGAPSDRLRSNGDRSPVDRLFGHDDYRARRDMWQTHGDTAGDCAGDDAEASRTADDHACVARLCRPSDLTRCVAMRRLDAQFRVDVILSQFVDLRPEDLKPVELVCEQRHPA